VDQENKIVEPQKNQELNQDTIMQHSDDRETQLKEENGQLKEQLLRALAEADNIRKRADREKADLSKYIISNFARDLLGVADNLSRALGAINADQYKDDPLVTALIEGIQMTDITFHQILERNGIQKMNPMGEKFDSNFHQAMSEVPHENMAPGHVVEVYQSGYMIQDRLLRPAMVAISKSS
jgi:molecular chaperone GrpE